MDAKTIYTVTKAEIRLAVKKELRKKVSLPKLNEILEEIMQ